LGSTMMPLSGGTRSAQRVTHGDRTGCKLEARQARQVQVGELDIDIVLVQERERVLGRAAAAGRMSQRREQFAGKFARIRVIFDHQDAARTVRHESAAYDVLRDGRRGHRHRQAGRAQLGADRLRQLFPVVGFRQQFERFAECRVGQLSGGQQDARARAGRSPH
jgi:hypothetical protein